MKKRGSDIWIILLPILLTVLVLLSTARAFADTVAEEEAEAFVSAIVDGELREDSMKGYMLRMTACGALDGTEEKITYGEPELVYVGETLAGAGGKVLESDAGCANCLREAMKKRQKNVSFTYASRQSEWNGQAEAERIEQMLDAAVAHTGKPTEGDYLRWHNSYWGYSCSAQYDYASQRYLVAVDFDLQYNDTAKQEAAVDKVVATFLEKNIHEGMTDYQKVVAIHDYLAKNVSYDYEHLNDENYKLSHSAYAALVQHTGVCQSFANSFYRLCLEANVDARYISGWGNGGAHGWNIVKLGDCYYNVDCTWDINYKDTGEWKWFLLCDKSFNETAPYHTRDEKFTTKQFLASYPMGKTNYDPNNSVKTVTLNKTTVSTNVGLTVQLKASVTPANANDAGITWKSSNSKVAKVNKNGLVTAVRAGTCKITASTKNKKKAVCVVTVKEKYAYELVKNGIYRYLTSVSLAKELVKEGWSGRKAFRIAGKSSKTIYQIYDKKAKTYRYTADKADATAAKKAGNTVSAAFYASEGTSVPVYAVCKGGKQPVWRYTASKATARSLKNKGWSYKGIAWYAEPAPIA